MRSSGWSSLAISACSALLLAVAEPAGAHIGADPAFLREGETEAVSLVPHNDRALPMTGFAVTLPDGLRVVTVDTPPGWNPPNPADVTADSTVAWTGGTLPADEATNFILRLEASAEPGTVSLRAEQRYPDGRVVRSPVALTVVPGDEEPSNAYAWAVVIGFGVLVFAGIGLVARRALRR